MKVLTLAAYAFAIWNLWKWLDVLKEAAFFDFLSRRLQTKRKNFTHSDHHPRVSVIVPACNEENDIVETLESLQSQTYPNFEVIAVNDRSTDNTGRLIEEFCKDKANFHAIEVRELPGGWLGQNHAMHIGSKKASGDYLLFTDAD
ncbi:MAG: glycosyltransferase family A protein, partial [Pseudomonadota bacterium]